jgi:hypothetical protein
LVQTIFAVKIMSAESSDPFAHEKAVKADQELLWEKIQEKLQYAYKNAMDEAEYDSLTGSLQTIERAFLSGEISLEEEDHRVAPLKEQLGLKGAVLFDTISEYTLAMEMLRREKIFSATDASDILDHENAHALASLEDPNTQVSQFGLRFLRRGTTIGIVPFHRRTKIVDPADPASNRAARLNEISRPDKLSDGDKAKLPKTGI